MNITFPSEIWSWISSLLAKMNLSKINVLRLTLLFLISQLFFSCSDDPEEVYSTFLQKNNHTEWVLADPDLTVYIRMNIEKEHLIEQWRYLNDKDCFEYNSNIFIPGDYQILENSEDQLVVSCDPFLGDCLSLTFHMSDNDLQVDIKISEWEEETVYFIQSKQILGDLKICDVADEKSTCAGDCPFFILIE